MIFFFFFEYILIFVFILSLKNLIILDLSNVYKAGYENRVMRTSEADINNIKQSKQNKFIFFYSIILDINIRKEIIIKYDKL